MFTKHFGLKANPFSLTADFSFFKIDAPKQAICKNLIHELNNGCCRFVVTGSSGIGKSQLIRYLFTQLPPETQSISLSGNCLSYSDRIRFIIELTTENHLLGKKSLVVIDNAHEIPEEELSLLFALISQNNQTVPALPIIFCGLSNLEKKLEPIGFKQIIGDHCGRYHVSAINEAQVRDYINFRLNQVGYENTGENELFSTPVIKLITALSQGIPHNINLICGASLLIACLDDQRIVSEQIVYEVALSCLPSLQNTYEMHELSPLITISQNSEASPELDDPKELSNQPGHILPLPSFMALPAGLSGILRELNDSRLKSMQGALSRKPLASANQPASQKRFEKEVLSGMGVGFLAFSCLLLFNWFDHSNIIPSTYEMLAESSQMVSEKKNFFLFHAFAETHDKTIKTVKQAEDDALNGKAWASDRQELSNDGGDVLFKSSPMRLVSFATEKLNFYQAPVLYPPLPKTYNELCLFLSTVKSKSIILKY